MRLLLDTLRSALQLPLQEEDAADGEYVGADEYRGIIGKCPDTWNFDGKACQQVRPGPKKFRIGSFQPEIRDKLRAAKKATTPPGTGVATKAAAPKKRHLPENPITLEATVPPSKGAPYDVDPMADRDKDGVTDAARVGVPGGVVPTPPPIPRLPNLTKDEREVEDRFAESFEEDSGALVDEYLGRLARGEIGDAPNVFSTDDAKLLSPDYNPTGPEAGKKDAMGRYNVVVHQTANAVAKKAFLKKLDELAKLPKDDLKRSVLMTCGGVASGKGYALGKVDETKALGEKVGAIWDSAGEQNGTESPWVLEEASKRGLKAVFVFVDSDPKDTWANPARGVVERAKSKGRMVDARVFADSYAIGARNFQAMADHHKDQAEFFVLSSRGGGKPARVPAVPEEALKDNADDIYQQSLEAIMAIKDLPPSIKRGGTIGQRIWSEDLAEALREAVNPDEQTFLRGPLCACGHSPASHYNTKKTSRVSTPEASFKMPCHHKNDTRCRCGNYIAEQAESVTDRMTALLGEARKFSLGAVLIAEMERNFAANLKDPKAADEGKYQWQQKVPPSRHIKGSTSRPPLRPDGSHAKPKS